MFGTVSSRRRRALALAAALACASSACAPIGGVPTAADTTTFRPKATTTTPSAPAVPADFTEVFVTVSPAVLPITALTCDSGGTGSGFLVDQRTVVTAAHVVDGAAVVAVRVEGAPQNAIVLGLDSYLDLALLEIGRDAVATPFELADSDPTVGEDVAALGFPGGTPLSMADGTVTETGRTVRVEGNVISDLVVTDIAIRGGNSGGPLIDGAGDVVGIVIASASGTGVPSFAVPVSVVRPRVADPGLLLSPASPSCELPLGPEDQADTSLSGLEVLRPDLRATFMNYFGGINQGDYALAYRQLSPRIRSGKSFADFAEEVSSSFDSEFTVDYEIPGAYPPVVGLSFTSLQAATYSPDGETCTIWFLEYHFVPDGGGGILIDRADLRARDPCP